ncbi:hypothetical protein [Burkholderia diffusa]|uniref:hypothetical protein n=1 Tax=Burkholderia diffusa TaxID=488732 RepID=UPI003C7AC971
MYSSLSRSCNSYGGHESRGTSREGAPVDDPLHTVSAGGTHPAEVRALLIKYYSEGGQWQDARTPLHTFPTRDRIGLITIHGKDDAIVDIGMRMLTPRELARAQVRMIGNSVCPDVAA